jgi:hypothetical protein
LEISGLTEEYPVLTTYFEAEMIGDRYGFLTKRWDANETTDRQHWMKFAKFSKYEREFNRDDAVVNFMAEDHIFMRWKVLPIQPAEMPTADAAGAFSRAGPQGHDHCGRVICGVLLYLF